jgi:PHD/YefM family antitoxin component YafN of YafNO toxin-antitoxin module
MDDPVKISPGQLISSSKVMKSLGMYLDEVKKRPLFILRNNEVEAVLISIEDYRELLKEVEK